MKRRKRILNLLQENLTDFIIEIKDNSKLHAHHNDFNGELETHIQILLKSKVRSKINRIEIHRKINNLLNEEFKGGLHSLEININ